MNDPEHECHELFEEIMCIISRNFAGKIFTSEEKLKKIESVKNESYNFLKKWRLGKCIRIKGKCTSEEFNKTLYKLDKVNGYWCMDYDFIIEGYLFHEVLNFCQDKLYMNEIRVIGIKKGIKRKMENEKNIQEQMEKLKSKK